MDYARGAPDDPTVKKPTKAPNHSLAGLLSARNAFPNAASVGQPGETVFFEQPSALRKNRAKITK